MAGHDSFLPPGQRIFDGMVDGINICLAQGYAKQEELRDLKKDAERVLQLLNGYIRYLQKNKLESET